jgi:hypothetical protein
MMVVLLTSSIGYTIENHFCNNCQKNHESAWIIPSNKEESNHSCECSHENETNTNEGMQTIEHNSHTYQIKANLISILPQDNQDKTINFHLTTLEFPTFILYVPKLHNIIKHNDITLIPPLLNQSSIDLLCTYLI